MEFRRSSAAAWRLAGDLIALGILGALSAPFSTVGALDTRGFDGPTGPRARQ